MLSHPIIDALKHQSRQINLLIEAWLNIGACIRQDAYAPATVHNTCGILQSIIMVYLLQFYLWPYYTFADMHGGLGFVINWNLRAIYSLHVSENQIL